MMFGGFTQCPLPPPPPWVPSALSGSHSCDQRSLFDVRLCHLKRRWSSMESEWGGSIILVTPTVFLLFCPIALGDCEKGGMALNIVQLSTGMPQKTQPMC